MGAVSFFAPFQGNVKYNLAKTAGGRKGNKESCNCGLASPSDTGHHIVLRSSVADKPSLVDKPILRQQNSLHALDLPPEAGRSWVAIANSAAPNRLSCWRDWHF